LTVGREQTPIKELSADAGSEKEVNPVAARGHVAPENDPNSN